MQSTNFYPTPSKETIAEAYVGKSLHDIPTPAAVIDVAVTERNCRRMRDACHSLGLAWRAHIKTHKTIELTRLQVGDDVSKPANLVVSTLAELEFIFPLLEEYGRLGRKFNVLYGLPLNAGSVPRLAHIASLLSHGSISILLDDPDQLVSAAHLYESCGIAPLAFVKVDMGGRRAGVVAGSKRFEQVIDAALSAHAAGSIVIAGLYSHAGHSYGGDGGAAAMDMLNEELVAMLDGAGMITSKAIETGPGNIPSLVLSAGASPTALSVNNMVLQPGSSSNGTSSKLQDSHNTLSAQFDRVRSQGHQVEIHAGVYPTLDLQQLAARSVPRSVQSWRDISLTVLAEVHSVYPGRGGRGGHDEALIGAGGLALGREFCKAYGGMAMMTPWGRPGVEMPECDVEEFTGWVVDRFAQEHGIVGWMAGNKGSAEVKPDGLRAGQKVRLWPNHACITSSHFGWYFVVDGEAEDGDRIVDIWVKARGW